MMKIRIKMMEVTCQGGADMYFAGVVYGPWLAEWAVQCNKQYYILILYLHALIENE